MTEINDMESINIDKYNIEPDISEYSININDNGIHGYIIGQDPINRQAYKKGNGKSALITGVTGQDGIYLSKLLLGKGYSVYGLIRKVVGRDKSQLVHGVDYIYGDITDIDTIQSIFREYKIDEVYHLAAQSDVAYSFKHPLETYNINIGGTLNIINSIYKYSPDTRMYFAGTSELYGQPKETPQDESTPMMPRSPYAISKLSGYWTSKVYRDAYGLFISCGILYNHESEIRGENFVTRKIAKGVAEFRYNGKPFALGNMDARKDWGYAPDYVYGMYKMLQQDEPDDFVLATNELHTVREFLEESLKCAGIPFHRHGEGIDEKYVDNNDNVIAYVDRSLYRPLESDNYKGDYSKAKHILGWRPEVRFRQLVGKMVKSELRNMGLQ